MSETWFEISPEGWRRLNAGRPLGALLCEAVQNAFDEDVRQIDIRVASDAITVEDDGKRGLSDPKLAYTIFLTDKAETPTARGRQGRGLKELLAAMKSATVETVGFTVRFDADGRTVVDNDRQRGTVLRFERQSSDQEIHEAVAALRLIIPDENVSIVINGERLERPKTFATLPDCRLETVMARGGVERIIERQTAVTLHHPRSADEVPHIFEMGLPVAASSTPWHLDVGQRIPRDERRRGIDTEFRLRLLATLFESMVGGALPEDCLHDAWIQETLAHHPVSDAALRTYVRRAFPTRAVLSAAPDEDDRARQHGVPVVSTDGMSRNVAATLARVMETSAAYVARTDQTAEQITAVPPSDERVLGFYRHLAKKIAGRPIGVTLMQRQASSDGFIDDAEFDAKRKEIRINVLGRVNLRQPLSEASLGVLLHELAHAVAKDDGGGGRHDAAFLEAFERVAGRAAELLVREGKELASQYGITVPEPKR